MILSRGDSRGVLHMNPKGTKKKKRKSELLVQLFIYIYI